MAKVQTDPEAPANGQASTNGHRTAPPQPQAQQQGRPVPHDEPAERALLGAALLSYTALGILVDRVKPEQFYSEPHRQIAAALVDLYEAGDKADAVTVHSRLSATGSNVSLPDLLEMQGATPTTSNAGQYASLIAAAYQRRQMIAAARDLTEAAYEGGDPGRPLQQLKTVAESVERDSAEPLSIRWVDEAVKAPPAEPPVLVEGLMRVGELMVVGAPRAIGKSWLAMNLAALLGRGEGMFLGSLKVVEQARTLIAQGEIDEWNTSDRWRMLTGSDGPPPGVAETFDRWRVRIVQRAATRDGATDRWYDAILDGRLEQTVIEHKFRVLIIDPWAVYFAGSENSNEETEAALDKLRALAMRHGLAVTIMHHLGKGTEARDPEDLWRGASRLADWASTRVTLLPHYTDRQAEKMGMSRRQSRRYLDVRFLRRSAPTDDFSIVLDPSSGWWDRWRAPEEVAESRRMMLDPMDVEDACRAAGGEWSSVRAAAESLGVAQATAKRLVSQAVLRGVLEECEGFRGGKGYRLPAARLALPDPDDPGPSEPPEG